MTMTNSGAVSEVVTRAHRERADAALICAEVLFQGEYDEALDRVAQAFATFEAELRAELATARRCCCVDPAYCTLERDPGEVSP